MNERLPIQVWGTYKTVQLIPNLTCKTSEKSIQPFLTLFCICKHP